MEQLVEDVTGQPFAEVARERILVPAGMRLSTYQQPLPEERWSQAARGYREDGTEVEGEWHSYPEQAAAGLWTTPTELLTLSRHLLGILDGSVTDGVVTAETLDRILTPNHPGDDAFRGWGLGFGLSGEGPDFTFGHGGSNEGFKAQWTVYRNRGEGVAVMTNGDRGSALAMEIIRGIARELDWPSPLPRIRAVRSPAPEELAEYAGDFVLEEGGLNVTVSVAGGSLVLRVPGQGDFTVHAAAEDADTFFDREDGQELVFERDEDGIVVAVVAGGTARLVRVSG